MPEGEATRPRLGSYSGKAVNGPGDNISYQIVLSEGGKCTLDCIPEKSFFQGGAPPWHVEAKWELDDDEVVVEITKEDVVGPRRKTDVKIPFDEKDGSLTLKGTKCVWIEGPPDAEEEIMAKMSLKELKEVATRAGIDPAGCIEREQFVGILKRGRASGTLKSLKLPDSKETAVNEKMERLEAMEAALKEQQLTREIQMLEKEEALRKQQEALELHEEVTQKRRQSAALVQARIVAELDRVAAKGSTGGYAKQGTTEFTMGTKVLSEADLPNGEQDPLDTSDLVEDGEDDDTYEQDWASIPTAGPPVEPAS